jgi:hypothetical protein
LFKAVLRGANLLDNDVPAPHSNFRTSRNERWHLGLRLSLNNKW